MFSKLSLFGVWFAQFFLDCQCGGSAINLDPPFSLTNSGNSSLRRKSRVTREKGGHLLLHLLQTLSINRKKPLFSLILANTCFCLFVLSGKLFSFQQIFVSTTTYYTFLLGLSVCLGILNSELKNQKY